MKKTILTLAIAILCLALTSALFSLSGNLSKNPAITQANLNKTSNPGSLPESQNSYLTASLNPDFIPIRNWTIYEPDIKAKAAGIFDPNGEKFLYQKNIKGKLPIASLTKIMTAIIALENLGLEDIVTISKKAVMTEGENGRLIIGEELTVRDLLYIMLMESSNDAAIALADAVDNFLILMNKKAEELSLKDTEFVDSTGISKWNYSTVFDLTHLIKYSFNQSLIWKILGTKEIEVYSQDTKIKHGLINTNKLLGEIPEMIGGKTGFTDEAEGCMLTMIEIRNKPGEYLITIVLGSSNRELETKNLIEWVQKAYAW